MYVHVIYLHVHNKTKIYHTGAKNSKSNTQNVERDKLYIVNTRIHDRSLSCIGTGTSIKRDKLYIVNTRIHDCSLSCIGTGTSIKRHKTSFMFRFLDMTRSKEDSLCKQITVDVVAMLVGL